MTKPWIERLRGIDLFSQCTDKELEQIDALMTEVTLPEGKVLMREGEIGLEAFVIESGEAVVTRDGTELARRGPGMIVGEMALIDQGPRTATVTAATPMSATCTETSMWPSPAGWASASQTGRTVPASGSRR